MTMDPVTRVLMVAVCVERNDRSGSTTPIKAASIAHTTTKPA